MSSPDSSCRTLGQLSVGRGLKSCSMCLPFTDPPTPSAPRMPTGRQEGAGDPSSLTQKAAEGQQDRHPTNRKVRPLLHVG